jgi:FkbM family methyltransferase
MNYSYICKGPTNRKSITMDDFYNTINAYIKKENVLTIVDAGSMDGGDAIYFKDKYSNANVYAIEGLPDNYKNYLVNNLKINAINCVIASYDGNIIYYIKNINGIHGIYDRGDAYGNKTLELPCYKLSTIMKNNNIKNIDVLKIDVEGATLDLLQSLEDNLNDIKIMHIETETYPFFKGQTLHNEVCEFLHLLTFQMPKLFRN